jgi:hypothetical protein
MYYFKIWLLTIVGTITTVITYIILLLTYFSAGGRAVYFNDFLIKNITTTT